MLRYLTAGESHGKAIVALVDGFPAGVQLNTELIDAELRRRQGGYGRGGRQSLECDHVEVLSGVWRGITLGSPIALMMPNNDYKIDRMDDLERPRPGHGDLSGSIKYLSSILRDPGTGQRTGNHRTGCRRRLGQAIVDAFRH